MPHPTVTGTNAGAIGCPRQRLFMEAHDIMRLNPKPPNGGGQPARIETRIGCSGGMVVICRRLAAL
jgi:hypothetical protein